MTRVFSVWILLLFAPFTAAFAEPTPQADVTPEAVLPTGPFGCEAVVTFKWQPYIAPSSHTPAPSSPPSDGSSDADSMNSQEGVAGTVRSQGATEEEAKKAIEVRAPSEKAKAMVRCRDLHENLSGCVAAKFTSSVSVLSSLSFTARQELERAIQVDCQKQSGSCKSSAIGEVTCKVLPKTAADGSKTPESKDGEKDKDTKKKK